MSSYVLILTIIHAAIGAVDVQRMGSYDSYQSCTDDAVARVESQRDLYPDAKIKWECQRGSE